MDMSPVHKVWQEPSCIAQRKGEEDKADRKRGGRTKLGNEKAWIRQVPEGSGEQRKMEETGCEVICGASTTHAVEG